MHFLFNRYLRSRNHKDRREKSLSFSHTFLSLSLSLTSSNCKKCKENFFSLVSSESSVLREEHENAPFSLDKKKKKKNTRVEWSGGNLRFHPMYYLNAPFTDRRARRIVYRWRRNWSVSTSGAKRNNFPVGCALPYSKCETRGVSVVYTPL